MHHYDECMSVDPEELRHAMRQWATGVTIVTVMHAGQSHGMTVNTFTSISLTPPLVMVSVEQITNTHQLMRVARTFGVTILDESQQEISDQFAGRLTDVSDRLAGLETFTMVTGAPFISQGALAWFDCRVVATYQAGTHTVFIGDVLAVRTSNDAKPLVYFDRNYRRLDDRSVT